MRIILLTVVVAPSLFAQSLVVTQTANLVDKTQNLTFTRETGVMYSQPLKYQGGYLDVATSSGTLTWSATVSSTGVGSDVLQTACIGTTLLNGDPCFYLAPEYSNAAANVTAATATTTPTRYAIVWYQTHTLPVGTYTGTVTLTPSSGPPVTRVVTIIVTQKTRPLVTYLGSPVGCTNTNAIWAFQDSCLGAPAVSPTIGTETTDQHFGSRIRFPFGPGCTTQYGGVSAFDLSSRYIFTVGYNGASTCGIFDLTSNTLLRAYTTLTNGVDPDRFTWSKQQNNVMYFFKYDERVKLVNWNVVTNVNTVIADLSSLGAVEIKTGSQYDAAPDGYWGFIYRTAAIGAIGFKSFACMIDLEGVNANGLKVIGQGNQNLWCIEITQYDDTEGLKVTTQVAQDYDKQTGKRFLSTQTRYGSHIYTYARGETELRLWVLIGNIPKQPSSNEDEVSTLPEVPQSWLIGHGNFVQFKDGTTWIKLHNNEEIGGCAPVCVESFCYYRVASKNMMPTPISEGGGKLCEATGVGIAGHQSQTDGDIGPRELLYRMAAIVGTATAVNGSEISPVDQLNPPQVRMVEPKQTYLGRFTVAGWRDCSEGVDGAANCKKWAVGQTIKISNVTGNFAACLNGIKTITAIGATSFTTSANCTGVGPWNSTGFPTVLDWDNKTPVGGGNQVWLTGNGEGWRKPIASLKNYGHVDIPNRTDASQPYWEPAFYLQSTRCSTDVAITMMACVTNYGDMSPLGSTTIVIDTNYSRANRLVIKSIQDSGTAAIVRFRQGAVSAACTVTAWATPSTFVTPTATALAAGSTDDYAVLTGLSPNSQYRVRVACGVTGAFEGDLKTGPTLTGTGALNVTQGGGGTVTHGVTSALGSSCASPCRLTPSRGVYWLATGPTVVR